MILKNKIAIITGSSRGLGRVIATELAREGARVVINYLKNEDAAKEVSREIQALGSEALVIKADVSLEQDAKKLVDATLTKFGTVDILVNNAGISKDAVSWKMDSSVWDEVIKTNLYGVFNCSKAVLPHMREKKQGRIINISSVVGQMGVVGTSSYTASKAGIIGLTKTIAKEVANRGITVNTLVLGYIKEGMLLTLPKNIQDIILSQIPLGRFGEPIEVAKSVLFLCSDGAGYITGQAININGGIYV